MSSTKPEVFALVDCNNFFASCERVFNPKLIGRPLVILSSNDGCVISRSPEAKALGIKMGAPAFQHRDLFRQKRVVVLSSNFALYADMSARVMATLEQLGFPVHVYSIDEAFLKLPPLADAELKKIGKHIRETVRQWTGIPIAAGIAATKTLAKAANELAKKLGSGVLAITELEARDRALATLSVEDIWGIGPSHSAFLHDHGIDTALELQKSPDEWLKKHLTIGGLRTVWELRGISSIEEEDDEALAKSIVCSRSFGRDVTELSDLKEAVATYASRIGEKLRAQEALAGFLSVFITTKHYGTKPYYSQSAYVRLPVPSSFTPDLIHHAIHALETIFKKGYSYKKAGVYVTDIVTENALQLDIWSPITALRKKESLMHVMDKINLEYGKKSLIFASEGIDQSWKSKSIRRSQLFTTSWDQLPTVR